MLLEEFDNKKAYLYESVMLTEVRTFQLGESLGNAIMEAELTADQVNQLFQELEAGAAAGGNRTMLGKGVDAAKFVKASYDELKRLAQNTGPVSGFDAAFAKGAQALGQSLGGDQGVMKYINKYREFAKAHPTAQKVIYGSLIIAIGISAAMSGSAAALALKPAIVGIMKATDKLLQGESFSTAAMAGAEVFAAGEIAKNVGGWVKGLTTTGSAAPVDVASSGGSAAGDAATQEPTAGGKRGAARFGASQYSVDQKAAGLEQGRDLAQKMGLPPNSEIKTIEGVPVEIGGKPVPSELLTPEQAKSVEAARKMAIQMGDPDPLAGRPPVTGTAAAAATTDAVAPGTLSNSQAAKMGVSKLKQMVASGEITDEQSYDRAVRKVAKDLRPGLKPDPTARGMNFDLGDEIKRTADFEAVPKDGSQFTGTKADYIKKFIQDNGGTPDEGSFADQEKIRQGQRSGYTNQAAAGGGNILQPPVDIKGDPTLSKAYTDLIAKIQNTPDYNARNLPNDISNRLGLDQRQSSALSLIVQKQGGGSMQGFLDSVKGAGDGSSYSRVDNTPGVSIADKDKMWQSMGNKGQAPGVRSGATSTTGQFESIGRLSETQLNTLFMLAEAGMWDKAKAAIAGSKAAQVIGQNVAKGVQKAAQVGHNLTNKVTANKLQKSWVAAKSPMDSDVIYDLMVQAGVDKSVLDATFQKMNIEQGDSEQFKQLAQQIEKLDPTIKQQLAQFLKQALGPETAMAEEDHHMSQGYHVKNNSVYGKILAKDGVAVLTSYDEAIKLANKFDGTLIKPARNRYMVKVSEAPLRVADENRTKTRPRLQSINI